MWQRAKPNEVTLQEAQSAYNTYFEGTVRPILGVSDKDHPDIGFAELARRIPPGETRAEYVRLTLQMLQANIREHMPLATRKEAPLQSNGVAVAFALVAAALAYHYWGAMAALVAAAFVYPAAEETAQRNYRRALRQAEDHNSGAPGWQEAVSKWERACGDLRSL